MTQNDKTTERGNFVQYPCQLIYNCPNLNRDDRWALLSIMGVCWTEEFYKLSYRDVSKLSGIPLSMLSSITGKDGRPDKEGIMDRLKRLEYIYCALGKELNSATGKPRGNAQTYIKVNYTKIWAESVLYKITPYSPQKDFEPVSYTNRLTEKTNQPVSYTNAPVSHANTSVPNTNRPVSYTNAPVRDVSVNLPPYITYTNLDITDNPDKEFVASATLAQLESTLSKVDNSLTQQNATKGHASPTSAGLSYVHPEHSFITLDDLLHPTVMIVTLTNAFPHPYFSEMEDKRRERIVSWEVLPMLKKEGLEVEVRWEHETEQQTVIDTFHVSANPQELAPSNQHALESPVVDEKRPVVESQPVSVPPAQDTALLGEHRGSEMPSSTQADVESSHQASRQVTLSANKNLRDSMSTDAEPSERVSNENPREGMKQASGVNPIASGATNKSIERVTSHDTGNNSRSDDDNHHRVGVSHSVQSQVSNGLSVGNSHDVRSDLSLPADLGSDQINQSATKPAQSTPPSVQPDTPPAQPAPPKTTRGGKGKSAGKEEKPKKVKPVVSEEELTLRKEVHAWVDKRRGYKLYGRATAKQVLAENTSCITLAHMLYMAQYENNVEDGSTWDDLNFVWSWIAKYDKYWSQPDNRDRIGAQAILQMFAQIIQKKSKKPDGKVIDLVQRQKEVLPEDPYVLAVMRSAGQLEQECM